MTVFVELLRQGRINRPEPKVLEKIRASFASELLVNIDTVTSAVHFYSEVCALPSTITKAIVLKQEGVLVNGPLMSDKPKLLMGSREDGRQLAVKLLFVDNDDVRPVKDREAEMDNEVQCCKDLALSADGLAALVSYEVVTLVVPSEFVQQTRKHGGQFTALLMPRYLGSVARGPMFSKTVLAREARRLFGALRHIHAQGYVHMDVKGDNVFYDDKSFWFLGDFGSACRVGTAVHSTTEVFYHNEILGQPALAKYDWFMLLVMLLIEFENKEVWGLRFIEQGQLKVSSVLVMNEALRVIGEETYPHDLRDVVSETVDAYSSAEA